MQFLLMTISGIIIVTGLITMLYLIYSSLNSIVHPSIARAWFVISLIAIILAIVVDIIVWRHDVVAAKSVFEEPINFSQPFKLMEIK